MEEAKPTIDLKIQKEYKDKVLKLIQEQYPDKAALAYIHSYGCQQNVSDGEKIMGLLSDMGFGFTDNQNEADLIILNTCAVRENAEQKVFGNVGELKHLKNKNGPIIGICGCMAQQEHIVEKIKVSYPYVDLVFGTFVYFKLPQMLFEVLNSRKRVVDINENNYEIIEEISVLRNSTFKANIPVMYGCNNFCTYCIVPYVRGREKSRRPEKIIGEASSLVSQGYKEIYLLGQNVNSYSYGFPKLLREIDAIDGDFRIRFISSHPKDATTELIDTIIDSKKICKHLHLPFQAGSNRILSAMNRKYTIEKYLEIINYARSRNPEFSFSSDIIVGFPGETYEEFLQTVEIIKKVKFDNLFTFVYSKRTGTKAADFPDEISAGLKGQWLRELLDIQRSITSEGFKRYIGKTQRVLVDGKGKEEGCLIGKNDENLNVEFMGDEPLIGEFVNIKILKTMNWALLGEIVE
ncbi:MAG: tRNA (N6-isopentenyl adenosine(37)-C2)-methylthiotransferase MiaB [Oscillospiraceae bacterium]